MTPNRRILLNIVATYGRSLCALMCWAFVSRWVLAAGKSEFGVCGVVDGMTVIERMRGNARRRIGGGSGKIHGKGMNAARQSCEHFEG